MTQREQLKMDQLERDVARLQKERDDLSKRICEQNTRLSEQWKSVQGVMTQNLTMEQELSGLRKELTHSHCVIRLYEAAEKVMSDARSEAFKLKR